MAGNNPTQVNIGIGLDTSAFKNAIGLTRGEIASFVNDVKKHQSDIEKFNQKKRAADEALRVGAITTQKHTQMIQAYRVEYNQLTQAEKNRIAQLKRKKELEEYLIQLRKNSLEMELKSKEKERLDKEAAATKKRLEEEKFFEQSVARTVTKEQELLGLLQRQMQVLNAAGASATELETAFERYASEIGYVTPLAKAQAEEARKQAEAEKFRQQSLLRTVDKEKEQLALLEKQRLVLEAEGKSAKEIHIATERLAKEIGYVTENSRLESALIKQQLADEKLLEKAVASIKTKREQDLATIYRMVELMKQAGYSQQDIKKSAENMAREMGIITKEGRKQLEQEEKKKEAINFRKEALNRLVSEEERNLKKLDRQDKLLRSMGVSEEKIADARERYAKQLGYITDKAKAEAESIRKKNEERKMEEEFLSRIITKEEEIARKLERQDAFLKSKGIGQKERDIARERYAKELGVKGDTDATKPTTAEKRRKEDLSAIRSMLEQAKTAQQKYNEQIGLVERVYARNLISEQKRLMLLKQINKELKENQEAEAKKSKIGGGLLSRNLGQFGTGVMAGFGVAGVANAASQAGQMLGDFIADSVKIAMERQRIGAAMEALLGSEQAAQKLTQAMRQLDKQSMLTFAQISKGAQTLLGFGISQEMVMPSLSALSKISLGNAERFQSLSLAFGQVAASGKLAGQEILQMVNAGFNPLQEISRVTGRSVSELKADVEAGRVSFLQVAEAIITATEAGGRFEKISEKMLKTPAGMLAKLQSDFELIKADLGEQIMPSMVSFFQTLKDNQFVIEALSVQIADLFFQMELGLAVIGGWKKVFDGKAGLTGMEALEPAIQAFSKREQRKTELQQRIAQQRAEEAAKKQAEVEFNKLPPEERKKRLADEQAKADAFRTDQQRAKLRAEMQKKIQDLEDKTDRARYFREIGGHLAKFPGQIKLINDAMAEFDREAELRLIEERAKNIQDEINSMREESNKLGMREIDILIQKYGLNKRHLTLEEKRQKEALIAEQKQLDATRALERARALNPKDDVIQKVADIMLALERGFINAEAAQRMQIDAVKDLAKENEVNTENPKMMDLGRAVIESQKAGKVQQTQEVMKQKLIEIAGHAKQQVEELKKIPGFAERN